LLEKIGSGSFATVYRGRDLELGREIAIKQIHDQYLQDAQQLDRYWQEAQLLASFQHPNIVTIFDVVRERGWLILELMQSDLSRVASRKQMDLNALRTTLAHCLRALKFLHLHGIVHGDVKPSNMMIDRRRRVKIGDFGLARRVSDAEGSLIKGTTKYMAPEVVSDEFGDVGPASDLYSLGFSAYELMCGEQFESLFPGLNAFGRDRQMAWMMWHAAPDRRLPEIDRVLADVPDDLARTIQKLVAKPQSERYRSADEALSDLNIDIKLVRTGDETIEGLGKTTVGVGPVRANPTRWLAIGAFSVSLLMSLAVVFWPEGDARQQSAEATSEKPIAGIVRDVDPDDGELVLLDEEGVPQKFDVGKNPTIRLDDASFILLGELQKQDRVEIRQPATPSRGAKITALRPATGTGTINEVDPRGNKLTIHLEADPQPQDVPMYVPKGADMQLNGKPAKLAELQPDDRVEVVHIKDVEGRAPRSVIHLTALRSVQLIGFVREVKEDDDKTWLIVEKHGIAVPVEIAPQCRIAINGQTGNDQAPFSPGDLKPSDRVVVTHDAHATSIEAERRARQTGVVLKIDLPARQILVRSDDGKEVTYSVGETCRVLVDDKPSSLEGLLKFDKIEVTFDPAESTAPEARTLDVRHPRR
jgi:serine/threonine-protein kinase